MFKKRRKSHYKYNNVQRQPYITPQQTYSMQQQACVAPQCYNPQQQPTYNMNQQHIEQQAFEINPVSKYRVKPILTNNELNFYKQLRPVAEKLGYTVLTKVRIADFIEPCNFSDNREKQSHFNRIKSKHVDFALARKDNLQPILLIELDDSSHVYNQKTVERDVFINQVYSQAELDILHMNNTDNLEYIVTTVLNDVYNRYMQAVSQMI